MQPTVATKREWRAQYQAHKALGHKTTHTTQPDDATSQTECTECDKGFFWGYMCDYPQPLDPTIESYIICDPSEEE